MSIFFYIFIFSLGAIAASFAMLVGERLPRGKAVILSRSVCARCGRELAWRDLIPVFSWFWLKGCCRWCAHKISWQYPLSEVALGIIFVLIAQKFGLVGLSTGEAIGSFIWGQTIFAWCLAVLLLIIFVADLKYFLIPDKLLWILASLILAFWLFSWGLNLLTLKLIMGKVLAGLGFFIVFFALFFFSRGKLLGFGDVKYFLLAGFLLGFKDFFLMIFLASFLGSLVGVWQIIFLKKNLKSKLPFGVFLAPATLAAFVWGGDFLEFLFKFV